MVTLEASHVSDVLSQFNKAKTAFCDGTIAPTTYIYSAYYCYYYAPALSDDAVWHWHLSDVWRHLSRTGLSREQRGIYIARKTKISTEVSHMSHDSETTFNVKWSRSTGRFTQHSVYASAGSCSGARGNVLAVGTYRPSATLPSAGSAARGALAPIEGGEGRGHIVAAARVQLVSITCAKECFLLFLLVSVSDC